MIFVTGAARSGTSLVTKILKAHGCNLGDDRWINRLYENVSIRENILKPYLMRCGADPLGQLTFPKLEDLPPLPDLRERVVAYLPAEPRAYKDAKLTFVFPTFADAFPDAKWILVRRDSEQIVESCLRTPFMSKRKTRKQWLHWVAEHEKRFAVMRDELNVIEVWTDAVVKEPFAFADAAGFCGLEFSAGAVRGAVKPGEWHRGEAYGARQDAPGRARRVAQG